MYVHNARFSTRGIEAVRIPSSNRITNLIHYPITRIRCMYAYLSSIYSRHQEHSHQHELRERERMQMDPSDHRGYKEQRERERMQMYPSDHHGYKEQRERERMQMYPSDHHGYKEQQYYSVVEEDYIYKDEYSYNNSSSIMQMMKPDQHSLPKHTYNHNQAPAHASYGGGYKNPEKKAHVAHYYEEERRQEYDTRADHSAHGANRHAQYNGEGMGMNHHAGYGAHAHQGHYRPHRDYPEERKKPSVWDFRGVEE